MATYTNWDASLEYEAATNITGSGFPTIWTGHLINQPPLGFYTSAAVFTVFGADYSNGVVMTTLFGVAAVALVYTLGVVLYGRKTGLIASALFGLIPWHIYMSRIFLIDNQSICWSLLFLIVGVLAVRRNSDKLLVVSGVLFAVAIMTKLYAIFAIPPLLLILWQEKHKNNYTTTKRKFLLFAPPLILSQILWYPWNALTRQNFLGVYFSTDFVSAPISNPDPLFLPIIWAKVAGYCLFGAVTVSVLFAYIYRKKLARFWRTDLICLASIAFVAALSMVLVLGVHLTVPYVSVFKYTYMALPFFCLLAASIADKVFAVLDGASWGQKTHLKKIIPFAVGLLLIVCSLIESILFLNIWVIYASFGVDSVTYYPLNLYADTTYPELVSTIHYIALALVVATIVLAVLLEIRKITTDTASIKLSDQNSPT